METIVVTALAERHEKSLASEVWFLGGIEHESGSEPHVSVMEGDWETVDANVGSGLKVSRALKSECGSLRIQSGQTFDLYMLRHPWSGHVAIDYRGHTCRIDLYDPHTSIVRFDTTSGEVRKVSELEVAETLLEGNHQQQKGYVELVTVSSDVGPVRIEVTSMRKQVRLLFAGPTRNAERSDLVDCAVPLGWHLSATEGAERALAEIRLEGESGEIVLHGLTEDASLIFTRKPGAGKVAVRVGANELLLDLDGPEGFSSVPIRQVLERQQHILQDLSGFVEGKLHRALGHLDPERPIGLFVPRWKGVAMSTRCLFDQWLAFPPTSDGHPDEITDHDIERFAAIILRSQGQHFVVSGGDLFWIDIIRKVRRERSAIRFDLLWHSNYAQMGESHDWKLWEGWLAALREGLVTKVGVVKEGYDAFLRSIGFDSVFVPNAIPPSRATPSVDPVSDSVGIWLSGSSDYRKPVYPGLMALSLLGKYSLSAAGIGQSGLRLASRLGLRINEISPKPLSPSTLYRRMASTSATLYTTLSECSPMLPLESFALGVPCLVGPSSHLFRDHDCLSRFLVVRNPLDAREIALKLEGAIANRLAILEAYQKYADEEVAKSRQALGKLLA